MFFNVTRNNYVDVMDLVFNNSVVNWVNDIFYTKTEVDAINTSMKNYVGTVNTSMKNYVDDTFITEDTNAETICDGALYLAGNGSCVTDLVGSNSYPEDKSNIALQI